MYLEWTTLWRGVGGIRSRQGRQWRKTQRPAGKEAHHLERVKGSKNSGAQESWGQSSVSAAWLQRPSSSWLSLG